MRVIAGTVGGMHLFTPRTDIRPTMDRVKAAIFSSLGDAIVGARVLDLFAGSGALGIEALSRGAASATFVEKNRLAVQSIERNLAKTKLTGTVFEMDIFHFLEKAAVEGGYDFIFADPPYAKAPGARDFGAELLGEPNTLRALAPGGTFVLEKLPGEPLPKKMPWECIRLRRYGTTEVAFLIRAETGAPTSECA